MRAAFARANAVKARSARAISTEHGSLPTETKILKQFENHMPGTLPGMEKEAKSPQWGC
jgi:hypothetical protein